MIAQRLFSPTPDGLTAEEFQRLLQIRLQTLEDATRRVGNGKPLPIPWRRGWKASLTFLGRDRDGSIKAEVFVSGSSVTMRWRRRVRLVKQQRLNLR